MSYVDPPILFLYLILALCSFVWVAFWIFTYNSGNECFWHGLWVRVVSCHVSVSRFTSSSSTLSLFLFYAAAALMPFIQYTSLSYAEPKYFIYLPTPLEWYMDYYLDGACLFLYSSTALVPALVVAIMFHNDETASDSLSEWLNVLQSVVLPFAVLPLLHFCSSEQVMGIFVISRWGLIMLLAHCCISWLGWAGLGVSLSCIPRVLLWPFIYLRFAFQIYAGFSMGGLGLYHYY